MQFTLRQVTQAFRKRPAEAESSVRSARVHKSDGGFSQTFSVLRIRDFRVLETGMVLSMAAMQMGIISRSWLAYDISDSALILGVVAMARGLPQLFLSPIGGLAADRFDKRRLLLFAQSALAVLAFINALLVQLDVIQVWHLIAIGLAQGVVFPFTMPSRQAMIPHFAGEKNVGSAFAIDSAGRNLNRILAPSIGGVLIAWDPTVAFYAIAIAYAGSAFTVAQLPGVPNMKRKSASAGRDLINGFNYVLQNRTLLLLIMIAFIAVALVMPIQQFLPVFQIDVFDVTAVELGYMYTVIGVGALVGSVLIAGVANSRRRGLIQMVCGVIYGVSLAAFAISPSIVLALAALTVFGLSSEVYMTINRVEVITNTEPEVLGRVLGIYVMTWSLMPIAALPLGTLVDSFGAPHTFAVSGLVMIAILLVIMIVHPKVWKSREMAHSRASA